MTRTLLAAMVRRPGVTLAQLSCAAFLLLAAIGPSIVPYDPQEAGLGRRLLPPSADHWFGTDSAGLDVFSRVIAAARIDLTIALLGVALSVIVGIALGLIAGYFRQGPGRWLSRLVLVGTEMVQSFPVFVLAMAMVAFSGQRIENIIVAIAFVNAPFYIRLVSVRAAALRNRAFVEAATLAGVPAWRVMLRHLLPNSLTPVLVQLSVNVGAAVLLTAGLSFVGAGVRAPTPEWGLMIAQGSQNVVTGQWWPALFPGLALTLVVFSLAVVGDDAERRFDPRRRTLPPPAARPVPLGPLTPAEQGALIAASHLTVEITTRSGAFKALDDVSLAVGKGELVAIVGESGAGKSTLANALISHMRPGATVVGGRVVFDHGRHRSDMPGSWVGVRGAKIGYIVSNPASHLDPMRRIGDQVAAAFRLHGGLAPAAAMREAIAALGRMKIPDPVRISRVYPHQISGGMAQRVVIAIALVGNPQLIIADEPVSGLDVTLQREIMRQIAVESRERGASLIFITHDLGLAAAYCDRVLVMYRGRIVEDAAADAFFAGPGDAYASRLLAAARGGQPGGPSGATATPEAVA